MLLLMVTSSTLLYPNELYEVNRTLNINIDKYHAQKYFCSVENKTNDHESCPRVTSVMYVLYMASHHSGEVVHGALLRHMAQIPTLLWLEISPWYEQFIL